MNSFSVFSIRSKKDFEKKAVEIFRMQSEKNLVYKKYIRQLGVNLKEIKRISEIPFLPIEFFKSFKVISEIPNSGFRIPNLFLSSGTSGMERSTHHVTDISLYEMSFRKCFELFFGDVKQYAILALLPGYYENKNSSLIYMVMDLIKESKNMHSAFYNAKDETLLQVLKSLLTKKQKVILFGVSFALLDFAEKISGIAPSENLIVMETGGMKGKREEMTREGLHKILCEKFGVKKIFSEYGMTELLSQAYSKGDGLFSSPPWMKVFARDVNDPFQILSDEKTGALNIIDLANVNSCSFIATQDMGRVYKDGSFEVLGRIDNSDLRGCNLLMV